MWSRVAAGLLTWALLTQALAKIPDKRFCNGRGYRDEYGLCRCIGNYHGENCGYRKTLLLNLFGVAGDFFSLPCRLVLTCFVDRLFPQQNTARTESRGSRLRPKTTRGTQSSWSAATWYACAITDSRLSISLLLNSECSQGYCDMFTGECVCRDGYEGRACERLSCPSVKMTTGKSIPCGGHGVCMSMRDAGRGFDG